MSITISLRDNMKRGELAKKGLPPAIRIQPRLRRLLREVWERIPESDRAILLDRLWIITSRGSHPVFTKRGGIACASPIGDGRYEIWFRSGLLNHLDDGTVRAIIAHELAHALLGHDSAGDAVEDEAWAKAATWGFEPVTISARWAILEG